MLRILIAVALLVLPPATAAADALADFEAARKALEEKRNDTAIGLFTRVIRSGEWQGENLGKAHFNRGLAYFRADEPAKALDDFRSCLEFWTDCTPGLGLVVELGVRLARYEEARRAAEAFVDKDRDEAKGRWQDFVTLARFDQLNGRWREADVLLQRFSQIDPDRKPVELARARSNAALGLPAAAVGLVRKIDSLYTAVLTRADRGFERVWTDPGFLAATDVPAMMARGLAQAEAEAAANSAKLGTVLSLMQALRRVGRHDDAIAAGERVLASDLSRFADRAAMEVWIHDEIARAAKAKGNFGLAESAYRNGIERIGDANPEVVNILINAAAFLAAEAGKYQEAIELSERAKKVGASAFGVMQANSAAIAAYWGLGRSADLARIVAEMETDVEDNPSAAIEALLLLGRSGDAAAIVAAKLASPRHVDSMILNLQRFTAKRPPSGAAARTVAAGWEAVRRDPKVLAALSKVGRVTDVPAASYY